MHLNASSAMTPTHEQTLTIVSRAHSYEVHLGRGLLARTAELLAGSPVFRGRRCAVVTDDRVAALYAGPVLASLREGGHEPALVTVPAGEASKSLAEVGRVADALVEARLDRGGFVVALGGGVVEDLAGFVASIYQRGVPVTQIPTTIISQVDSAVGGKTGVNVPAGKNLLGTFHPPAAVVVDPDTLDTLPDREYHEGFAEIIKHAVIRDRALFDALFAFDRHLSRDALPGMIRRNLEIKAGIVAADEFERAGVRALLNFGHTVGHAVEQAAGYGRFLHGEAVALGMVAAGRLSMEVAGLEPGDFGRLIALLRHFRLPTRLGPDVRAEAIMASLARDKKFESQTVRFVLTPRIGEAFLSAPGQVGTDAVRRAVERLYEEP